MEATSLRYQNKYYKKKRQSLDELSPELISALNSANRLDIELYEYAKTLFQARYRAFLIRLLGVRKARQVRQQPPEEIRKIIEPYLLARYNRASRAIKRKHEITYTFDMPLEGDHWLSAKGQQTLTDYMWRWTTAKEATIDLPLKRDIDLEIRFRVKQSFADKITLLVDDRENVLLKRVDGLSTLGAPDILYYGILPKNNTWRSKPTTLYFCCDKLQFYHEHTPQNPDGQELGIAIDWIQTVPAKQG